jgi:signal transduction histidine kinase
MSIMGMKLWVYYLTWFIRYFAVYLVVHLIGSAILVGAFPHFTFFVPFIVFILFDILLIVQSFFIQIFFTRSKIGMVVALVFFIVQYVLSYTVSTTENPSVSIYQAISVVPHVAFILAFKEMLYAEAANTTVDFTSVVNYYTINTAIISLLCHIVLWIILTWYLDQVVPNEWGAKKHPCFCCVGPEKDAEDSEIQESPSKIHPMKTNDSDIESVEGKYKEMESN